jgi:hypothetical protein
MKPYYRILLLLATAVVVCSCKSPDYSKFVGVAIIRGDRTIANSAESALARAGIPCNIQGSMGYSISVPPDKVSRAMAVLTKDAQDHGYRIYSHRD